MLKVPINTKVILTGMFQDVMQVIKVGVVQLLPRANYSLACGAAAQSVSVGYSHAQCVLTSYDLGYLKNLTPSAVLCIVYPLLFYTYCDISAYYYKIT